MKRWSERSGLLLLAVAAVLLAMPAACGEEAQADLAGVKARGELRHLGVPYANFVTGAGDGLSVELIQGFAAKLGVTYRFVETSWGDVIPDLTGERVKPAGAELEKTGAAEVRGDLIACGLTILPWRQKVIDYSAPTFPTQVWLVVKAEHALRPIRPSGDEAADIAAVRALLKGYSVLAKPNTCLDPSLYNLHEAGATAREFTGSLNDLVPALFDAAADTTLLDVPDSLLALRRWPGKIKVIGPLSTQQGMGVAFRKDAPELKAAFDAYLAESKKDGTYLNLVKKYYPDVLQYYPEFFMDCAAEAAAKP